jgi:hypothetical protein
MRHIPWFPTDIFAAIDRVLDMAVDATMLTGGGAVVGLAITELTRGSLIWMALGGMMGATLWLVQTLKYSPSRHGDLPDCRCCSDHKRRQ